MLHAVALHDAGVGHAQKVHAPEDHAGASVCLSMSSVSAEVAGS